jgi:hypothetical protein
MGVGLGGIRMTLWYQSSPPFVIPSNVEGPIRTNGVWLPFRHPEQRRGTYSVLAGPVPAFSPEVLG